MYTLGEKQSPEEKLICALGEYGYLTVEQATRLLYAITSFTHVREKFKSLDDEKLVIVSGGRACNLPRSLPSPRPAADTLSCLANSS